MDNCNSVKWGMKCSKVFNCVAMQLLECGHMVARMLFVVGMNTISVMVNKMVYHIVMQLLECCCVVSTRVLWVVLISIGLCD